MSVPAQPSVPARMSTSLVHNTGAVQERLVESGLTVEDASLYMMLCLQGPLAAASLAQRLAWPRSKAYRILESMQNRGLVVASMTRPLEFSVIAPAELFQRLADSHQAGVLKMESAKEDLLPILSGWYSSMQEPNHGRFRVLVGARSVNRTLHDMLDGARKSILLLRCGIPAFSGPETTNRLANAAKRGVKIHVIGDDTTGHHGMVHSVPSFLIVDGEHILYSLRRQETGGPRHLHFMWSDASGVVESYSVLFQQLWGTES